MQGVSAEPRGFLVVIEGIDGAGKSTLASGLAEQLERFGHHVVRTREPTEGPFGRRIRALAASERSRVPADEEWRLFHEDRRIHVQEVVNPSLASGSVVVQDRSWYSTVAYQGERGLDREMLRASERRIAPDPDLLLVVDLAPEKAFERIHSSRGRTDDFESLDLLKRVREVFLSFDEAVVLDGEQPSHALVEEASRRVREAIRQRAS